MFLTTPTLSTGRSPNTSLLPSFPPSLMLTLSQGETNDIYQRGASSTRRLVPSLSKLLLHGARPLVLCLAPARLPVQLAPAGSCSPSTSSTTSPRRRPCIGPHQLLSRLATSVRRLPQPGGWMSCIAAESCPVRERREHRLGQRRRVFVL